MTHPLVRTAIGAGAVAAGVGLGALAERGLTRRLLRAEPEPWPAPVPHRTVELAVPAADGIRLRVRVETAEGAPAEQPTVILSHGYGLGMAAWAPQRSALLPHARVVTWDQRGHGRSGWPSAAGAVDLGILGDDLARVIEAVGPAADVVLAGHSMGGMTVMALAESHPDLLGDPVRGVALLSTSAGRLRDATLGLPAPLARVAHRLGPGIGRVGGRTRGLRGLEALRGTSSDLVRLVTRAYAFGEHVPPGGVELVDSLITATPLEVLMSLLPALQEHDRFHALDALRGLDLLVIVGEADRLTPVEHSVEIVRRVPGAELLVLPGAGHMVGLECVEQVDAALIALVSRTGTRS